MLNHSIVLFRLDGAPVMEFSSFGAGPCITFRDRSDSVDFYIPREHAERVRRAVVAFNQEMQREPAAQQQAAE